MFLSLLIAAAFASPSSPTTFEFVGQPDCVSLTWEGERTRLVNDCEHPLLVDQSVHLWAIDRPAGIVAAHSATEVRDLSAFTLGLEGALYRVVAVVAEPEPEPESSVPGRDAKDAAVADGPPEDTAAH